MVNMDFWFFWGIFRKRWNIILFFACAASIITGVCSELFLKPVYRSEVTLYFGKMEERSDHEKRTPPQKEFGVSEQLRLGSQLSQDYQHLINAGAVKDGVEEELAKQGKTLRGVFYTVETEQLKDSSRYMKIIVESYDAVFSQQLANIYAEEFKKSAPVLVGVQNITTLNSADLNTEPVFPEIKKNILIAFGAGFILMYLIFIAARLLNRGLWSAEEAEKALDVPVIGTIRKDRDFILDKKTLFLFGDSAGKNPRSQLAEDFRVVRVNLINWKKEGDNGKVLAVTSAQKKEGKTFCTANLSAALAEAGFRVLLIDCDTGTHGVQDHLGITNEKGIMNILEDNTDFKQTVRKNFDHMNLDLLLCGNRNVNAANLMLSQKFKDLMTGVRKEYDYTFLDVSCQMGAADIVSAGSAADSVLLLVRAGKTEESSIKRTIEALKRAGIAISGVLLNGVEEH